MIQKQKLRLLILLIGLPVILLAGTIQTLIVLSGDVVGPQNATRVVSLQHSPSFGASAAYISRTVTAGTGGVTQNLIASKDASNPTLYVLPGAGGCGSGFAATTAIATATFELITVPGSKITAVADGTITAGHILTGGSSTPGRVADTGQTARTAVAAGTCIIGVALASATVGNNVLIGYDGTGIYGAGSAASLNFPVTVSGTVTSGGIPYFNSATQASSSALLCAGCMVVGGGAGATPSGLSNILGTSASTGSATLLIRNPSSNFPIVATNASGSSNLFFIDGSGNANVLGTLTVGGFGLGNLAFNGTTNNIGYNGVSFGLRWFNTGDATYRGDAIAPSDLSATFGVQGTGSGDHFMVANSSGTSEFKVGNTGIVNITTFYDYAGELQVTSQFDKTSDVSLANVPGLSVTVVAGRSYRFVAELYTTSSVAGGVQSTIGGTATATAIVFDGFTIDSGLTTQSRSMTLGSSVGAVTAVTAAHITIKGTITVNAGGTLTVQFAQNSSSVTASSVLIKSTFTVQDIR